MNDCVVIIDIFKSLCFEVYRAILKKKCIHTLEFHGDCPVVNYLPLSSSD